MALLSTLSRSNWNLEMLVSAEGGKPDYPEKNPRSRDENQQQTQPTYDTESGNRIRAALVGGCVGGECSTTAPSLLPYLISPCRGQNTLSNKGKNFSKYRNVTKTLGGGEGV